MERSDANGAGLGAMSERLLDPQFLSALEALRRKFVSRARSGAVGEGVAQRRGASSEFREHRPYTEGDDLRRVDWLAFARTGEPVLKLFNAEEDSVVRVLVDASASLEFGTPSKLTVARKTAAAIAYLGLAAASRVQLIVTQWDDNDTDKGRFSAPQRGRSAFLALCRELEALRAEGRTNLARALDRLLKRSAKPGVLLVLSDFLDPGPVLTALSRARAARHEVVLVHIFDSLELDPDLEGDYSLIDAETGAEVTVTVDASTREAYKLRFERWVDELRSWARHYGGAYIRSGTHDSLEDVVRRVVARSID